MMSIVLEYLGNISMHRPSDYPYCLKTGAGLSAIKSTDHVLGSHSRKILNSSQGVSKLFFPPL